MSAPIKDAADLKAAGGLLRISDSEPIDLGERAPVTIGMRLTDLGNAERLVACYRDRIRYCPPRRKWLMFDGKRYAWDETGEVHRLAKQTVRAIYGEAKHAHDREHAQEIGKHAHRSESAGAIEAMLKHAQSEPGIPVMPIDLDSQPHLLCAQNGTVDLRDGTLLPHDREHLITKIVAAQYVPGAQHETWNRYLHDATGGDGDLAAYMQRSAGCALWGAVLEKAFWFFFGPPNGSKSTFINAYMGTLGDYAVAADFATWLIQSNTGGNRGDLVSLLGARLVTSVEVRKGARFDESIIKKVTGGDRLKYAAKFEAEIEFSPSFCLWLAANDAPTIRDDDEGSWSRVRRVPFVHPVPVERQDRTMPAQLATPGVRAAILAWAVEGCLAWQRDGLGSCAAVETSTADYRSEMDRLAGFVDAECIFEPSGEVDIKDFRDAYHAWCDDQSIKPLGGKDLVARLLDRGAEPKKSGARRFYRGVRWATDRDAFGHLDTLDKLPPNDFSSDFLVGVSGESPVQPVQLSTRGIGE